MSNIFSAILTIGRDAEVRHTASGVSILTVTGANNTGYGDNKKTHWVRCSIFGKRAEGGLVEYLKKGQQIFVSGELSLNEYQKDGQTKTSLELNTSIIDLVGGKREPVQDTHSKQKSNGYAPKDNFDDGIPF